MLTDSIGNKDVTISTAADVYKGQKYIDFIDPSSGMPVLCLEWVLGARGFPVGRITQLRASFSAGKSSFLYYIYACATRGRTDDDPKAWVGHIETEGAPNPPDYIAAFGLDPNAFLYMSANSLDTVFITLDGFICGTRGGFGGSVGDTGRPKKTAYVNPIDPCNKYPIVLGVDSFSALGEKKEADVDVLDISNSQSLAYLSRSLRRYLRDRQQRFARTDTTLFVTSLETSKVMTGPSKFMGPQKSAIGQEALGGAMSFGLDVSDRPWKEDGVSKGSIQSLKTFKNKFAPRYRTVELYRKDLGGYDMAASDVNFLISHPASPFADGRALNPKGGKALYRTSAGLQCPALSDKAFKSDAEFVASLYGNEELLGVIRESMRIRGFGFDFETKYSVAEAYNQMSDTADPTSEEAENGALEESDGYEEDQTENKEDK